MIGFARSRTSFLDGVDDSSPSATRSREVAERSRGRRSFVHHAAVRVVRCNRELDDGHPPCAAAATAKDAAVEEVAACFALNAVRVLR